MALKKLKSNSLNSVSFGTEAGVFDKLNFETIVCGPGDIQQAHKPNEFIDELQLLQNVETFSKFFSSFILNFI